MDADNRGADSYTHTDPYTHADAYTDAYTNTDAHTGTFDEVIDTTVIDAVVLTHADTQRICSAQCQCGAGSYADAGTSKEKTVNNDGHRQNADNDKTEPDAQRGAEAEPGTQHD